MSDLSIAWIRCIRATRAGIPLDLGGLRGVVVRALVLHDRGALGLGETFMPRMPRCKQDLASEPGPQRWRGCGGSEKR